MGEKSARLAGASAAEAAGAPALDALARLAGELGPERWRATSDAAQVVACYLACHPRVAEVRYPGLKADPDFARAANELRGGFGPRVAFRVVGEGGAWHLWEAGARDFRAQVSELEALLAGR